MFASSPSAVSLLGAVLAGRYHLQAVIGVGAMATVYRAVHAKMRRKFAVKVMHRHLASSPNARDRFTREAELGGRLSHPNLIGVVDLGEIAPGVPFLVMDLAAGVPLAHLVGETPMEPATVIAYAKQLCDGLQHAHDAGITHRDFKPDNVMVERVDATTERLRIVDFGIAMARDIEVTAARPRLTTEGVVVGTPAYMAPEHAQGFAIDARADLYSLGIVLFEMLTGVLPFEGDGVELARANVQDDVPAMATRVPFLDVDPLLEALTRALLVKSCRARLPSATRVRELLVLIETDRDAAARALGVSLRRSDRMRTAMPPLR